MPSWREYPLQKRGLAGRRPAPAGHEREEIGPCHVTNSSSNNCNTFRYYITYVIVAYNNCSCQPIIMLKCEVGAMNNEPLKIKKRGEDGNRIISVRIREEILTELDKIAGESNYSRNELINLILDYGIKHIEIE